MVTIYHNPKCSKSREGVEYLKSKVNDFKIIDYIKTGISEEELKRILKLLKMSPVELVRTNEAVWKESYKDKDLTDEQVIKTMVENPKLIQRPIIINGDKAVVGRPTENIKQVL